MEITIYDTTTTKVLRCLCGPETAVLANVETGEDYIEGLYDLNGTVVSGAYVAKTETYPSYPADTIMEVLEYAALGSEIVIQALQNTGLTQAEAEAYVLANYAIFRKKAYPDIYDYIDAQVKINSSITARSSEGDTQLEDYVDACLAVKTEYPEE